MKSEIKEHTLKLAPEYFELIKSGEKILEGRLYDEKRKSFEVGDTITFIKEPERLETLKAIILEKLLFSSFDEMVNQVNKKDLGFKNQTKQQIVDVYRNIYSREEEKLYGVVIFKIKTL